MNLHCYRRGDAMDAIFGGADKRYFCNACKYPNCSAQTSVNCEKTRGVDTKKSCDTKNRFKLWTCKVCAVPDVCSTCGRNCLEDRKQNAATTSSTFGEAVAKLRLAVASLQRLPTQREEPYTQEGKFVNHCRKQ